MYGSRRVITVNRDGKSIFSHDEAVDSIEVAMLPGGGVRRVYGAKSIKPEDEESVDLENYFPSVNGMTVTIITLPPDPAESPPDDFDMTPLIEEVMEKLPGFLDVMEPDGSGMHTTQTTDIVTVLQGRVVLELDDGQKQIIEEGDVVVQRATRHSWKNPFNENAILHAVSIGIEE